MKNREVTFENVKYGMLVEVLPNNKKGRFGLAAGCKVHFFNKKGVLIGLHYQFIGYDEIRLRKPYELHPRGNEKLNKLAGKSRDFPRYFMNARFYKIKHYLFRGVLWVTTKLIKFTQSHMD